MKITTYNSEEEWLEARRGKITGTRAGSLMGKRDGKPKKGYYELIAERVALPPNGEFAMDRGKRLEDEAVERFAKETKKKVNTDLVIWHRDEDENIAISPDGSIGKTEAVECKCLNSASHIEAWLTKQVPDEYETQVIQYFVVNDKLKKLYFLFYDPRMPIDFFFLEVKREDMQEQVDYYLELERRVLKEVEEIEAKLTF